MKKKISLIIAFIMLGIMLAAGIRIIKNPYYKVRLYLKDRITGNFRMTVNGKEYIPFEKTHKYESSPTRRLRGNGNGDFSIKGGKYGMYEMGFHVENSVMAELTGDEAFLELQESTPVIFAYINTNWWHIAHMNLKADLFNENGEWIIKLSADCTESTEVGSPPSKTHKEYTAKYFDESREGKIRMQIGP